jgi:hypothetical protein
MSPRSITLIFLSVLALGGCKDREIASYRAPKDPPPAMPPAQAAGMPAAGTPAGPFAGGPADQSMANTAVPTASGSDLTWKAPAQWTAKPVGAMRKGSFAVKGDGGADADLSITAFPGSTGGLLANLNRWRGQLGLPPFTEDQLGTAVEHLDAGNLHFQVVDFAGKASGAPARIVGAIVAHGSDTWFFKLMGPDELVAQEKPVFQDFLKTVTAP